jgi:hypothetical protein
MSLLALISIHLKLHGSIAAEHPIVFRPHRKLEDEVTEMEDGCEGAPKVTREELDCICGMRQSADDLAMLEKISGDTFLMDCDSCHIWYHGSTSAQCGLHSDVLVSACHC